MAVFLESEIWPKFYLQRSVVNMIMIHAYCITSPRLLFGRLLCFKYAYWCPVCDPTVITELMLPTNWCRKMIIKIYKITKNMYASYRHQSPKMNVRIIKEASCNICNCHYIDLWHRINQNNWQWNSHKQRKMTPIDVPCPKHLVWKAINHVTHHQDNGNYGMDVVWEILITMRLCWPGLHMLSSGKPFDKPWGRQICRLMCKLLMNIIFS